MGGAPKILHLLGAQADPANHGITKVRIDAAPLTDEVMPQIQDEATCPPPFH
jgi:hypothetical protein